MITIKINHEYRRFKEGEEFNLDVSPSHILVITGSNGLGKSSLLRGIRGIKDSLKDINRSDFDGMTIQANTLASMDFNANASIEGLDEFEEVYCLDRVTDDPNSFEAAATASGLIGGGGFYAGRMSGGQKSIFMLHKFIEKIEKIHKKGANSLVILDEVDSGFDIYNQINYLTVVNKKFRSILENPSIIVVTHNPLSIISRKTEIPVKVYDMDIKYTVKSPKDWFYIVTGIKLSYDDN